MPLQHGQFIEVVCPVDNLATEGKAIVQIVMVDIADGPRRIEKWLGSDLENALGSKDKWMKSADIESKSRIVAVRPMPPSGVARDD